MVVALLVAAVIAGHPVSVHCDADQNNPFGFQVWGWAPIGGNEVHLAVDLCVALEEGPRHGKFATALNVLIHEAAHAHGWRWEACAEYVAQSQMVNVLVRFYKMRAWSRWPWKLLRSAQAFNRMLPPEYRPDPSRCVP